MKVEKLHIYGYGQWEDYECQIKDNGIQLFLGRNESGKSTLMSFIQSILFGFPKKGDNQYIPYSGTSTYGGKIVLVTDHLGKVTIERVKGRRARGDVTVYFEDGRSTGEEGLDECLRGLDLSAYQGIFHFDLDGLNGLDKLNPEELNQFLYDTGLGGGQSISILEKKITGEMESLFKPKGKKTEINALSMQMEQKERDIHQWNKRIDQYDFLNEEINEINHRLKRNKDEQNILTEDIKIVEKIEALSPLAREWEERRLLLEEEKEVVFPEGGIARLEAINEKLLEKETAHKDLQHELEVLRKETDAINVHVQWPEIKSEINQTVQEYDYIRKYEDESQEYNVEREVLVDKMEKIDELWFPNRLYSFANIPLHSYMKSKFQILKEKWEVEQQKELRLQEEKEILNREIELRNKELTSIEETLLEEDVLQELEGKVDQFKNESYYELEKSMFIDRLTEKKEQRTVFIKREKNQKKILLALTILLLLLSFSSYFFINGTTTLIIGIITMVFIGMLFWKNKFIANIQHEMIGEEEKLTNKIQSLDIRQNSTSHGHMDQWKKAIAEEQKKRRSLERVSDEQRSKLDRIKLIDEQIKHQLVKLNGLNHDLFQWCKDYSLPTEEELPYYKDVLIAADEWKLMEEKIAYFNGKIRTIFETTQKYSASLKELVERIGYASNRPISNMLELLKNFLQDEDTKVNKLVEMKQLMKHRDESMIRLSLEKNGISIEKMTFLSSANVDNDEKFRNKGIAYERHKKIIEEKKQYWIQMKILFSKENQLVEIIQRLLYRGYHPKIEQEKLNKRKEELLEENEGNIKQLTELNKEVSTLEEDGTYEELLQTFSQMREELHTLVKKWATLAISKQIIDEIKGIYEKEKQPEVIQEAERLFCEMTGRRYVRLFAPLGEEKFIIERSDGARFDPSQLSRGTCELLYLSLRFSLATLYKKQGEFPILMDEALVNMDKGRRINVLSVIKGLAKTRQIFFFTCHEHIEKDVDGNVIHLIPHSFVKQ